MKTEATRTSDFKEKNRTGIHDVSSGSKIGNSSQEMYYPYNATVAVKLNVL